MIYLPKNDDAIAMLNDTEGYRAKIGAIKKVKEKLDKLFMW